MLHELTFESYNERDTVYAWIYVPASEYKGIIQVVHGFGEHSRRYLHMISSFLDAGFIVAANDHVGHGKTAIENDTWGDWGTKGYETMREDEHQLMQLVKEKYPNLPYYFFGHSMGSAIVRDLLAHYGEDVDKAIICGTLGTFPVKQEVISALEKEVEEGRGAESDPQLAAGMLSWLSEGIDDIKLGNEWICANPYVQKDHAYDPFNAFGKDTTNESLLYFAQMILNITGEEWAEQVPQDMPLLVISGDQDPVGNFGEGVKEVESWLKETGHQVDLKLYEGYRHEIHNYPQIRDQVEDLMIDFLQES